MTSEEIKTTKNEIQKILDRHLKEEQRFSIQELDEESTFQLIELLIEKDEKKREKIRAKVQKDIKTNKMNIELDYENILKIKDKLDYLNNDYNDLDNLKNTVNTDTELDNQLNNI